MERERRIPPKMFHNMALDYWLSRGGRPGSGEQPGPQPIPVNMYETQDDIVVVAPMPGVEAEDIDIELVGNSLTLRAALRGPGQLDRPYLVHEWTYGPYERTVTLPVEVDSEQANASHGNGVLVLSLPKSRRAGGIRIQLNKTGAGESRLKGHSGHKGGR